MFRLFNASVLRSMLRPAAVGRRFASTSADPKKALLLYSGGLDTSCILQWLLDEGYSVQAFIADLGQEEDFEAAREKALGIGAEKVHTIDLKEDFLMNYIVPFIKCNGLYENLYLMGTSLARPCISKAAIDIAKAEGCGVLSHGATGKGNDQVRFELSFYALQPDIQVLAPWRERPFFERFKGRQDLIEYASSKGIPVVQTKGKPYSMDENMLHISYEAGILEDPALEPPKDMFRMTVDPQDAPDKPLDIRVHFEKGIPIAVTNVETGHTIEGPLPTFTALNSMGGQHGVGRVDVVENRFVGIKSRGIYETPAGTILRTAHIGLEGLTVDREVLRMRDMLSAKFSEYCYNGFWFSPEMEFILNAVEKSQENVSGAVTMRLFKGNASIIGRQSPLSLYDQKLSSMDEHGGYDAADAAGFIRVNAIRLKAHSLREGRVKKEQE